MKKKILILGFTKIAYMPYLNFYLEQLNKGDYDISLFYWDRDGKPDKEIKENITLYKFQKNMMDSVPKINKITNFLEYRREVKKLLKHNRFDMIIVLHTLPGILLYDELIKNYNKKFILDYRDFTYENISLYKKRIHKLCNSALATFVSSDAFRVLLPDIDNIYTSHNLVIDSLKNRTLRLNEQRCPRPIRIRYWGLIRYTKTNIALIKQIANDERFEMHFHGRSQGEALEIQEYCNKHLIKNAYFHGEYLPEEKYRFAMETDIIQNAQDLDRITQNAVSNKFYDSAIFYIPQLCTKGSFMGTNVENYGLGLAVDLEKDNISQILVDYFNNIDWTDFSKRCDSFIEKVTEEYETGLKIIQELLA